ncbi:MAG: ABC transporter permease [Bryobacteraceae bacterium]
MKPYLYETKSEFLSLMRMPRYAISTLILPLLFYCFFGLGLAKRFGHGAAAVYLGSYSAWGVMGACLWGIGAAVASERGFGWLQLKRASPMPPLAYFVAKLASAFLFSTLVMIGMFLLAGFFGGVHFPASQWARLALALWAGTIPFCALGFLLGYLMGPTFAPAVVNLVFLPMLFLSGIWIPLQFLPEYIQHIAPALPSYHLAQLTSAVVGAGSKLSPVASLEALFAFTLIFGGAAWLAWRREETKVYG